MEESSSKSVLSGYAYYLAEQNLLDKEAALHALQQASANGIYGNHNEHGARRRL